MIKKSSLITSLLIAAVSITHATAAEFPQDLQGKWAWDSPEAKCADVNISGLVIDKKTASYGTESSCQILKVTGSNGKYRIQERCSSEDGSSKSTEAYALQGSTLTIGEKQLARKLRKCE